MDEEGLSFEIGALLGVNHLITKDITKLEYGA
jgi:hypothetical protein